MNAESKDFVMEEILVYEIKTEFEIGCGGKDLFIDVLYMLTDLVLWV